jgi:hypothetical protein
MVGKTYTKKPKQAAGKRTKKRPRGKPFVSGDPRINRAGVSKEQAALQEIVRQTASAVLLVVPDEQKHDVLTEIFLTTAKRAVSGDQAAAEFLLKCAGWSPKQSVELSGPDGGAIIFDMPGPERERTGGKQ